MSKIENILALISELIENLKSNNMGIERIIADLIRIEHLVKELTK